MAIANLSIKIRIVGGTRTEGNQHAGGLEKDGHDDDVVTNPNEV